MNGYELSKAWFKWCGDNRHLINPNHHALYFWIVEKANSLTWSPSFGLPSGECMHFLGINSYKTYIKTFEDLEKFGFIKVIERSKNQYTTNIIELVNFTEATTKADTKATTKAQYKASPMQSDYNKTNKLINLETDVVTPEQKETPPPPRNLAKEELQKFNANREDYLGEQETRTLLIESQSIYEHFARNTVNDKQIFEKVIDEFFTRSSADGKYPRPFKDSRSHFNNYAISVFRSKPELFKKEQPKPQTFSVAEETPEMRRTRKEAEGARLEEYRRIKEESDRREREEKSTQVKKTIYDYIPSYVSA